MFMEEGFDEFVSKPIETMTLERVLCKVLPKSSITYVSEEKEAVKTDERKTNFDRNAGLQYCRGDEMFYRELLAQFHGESVKKRQMIEADYEQKNKEKQEKEEERRKEKQIQKAILNVQKKYGKNALIKGMNLQEGATTMERNRQIGGHKA